MDRRTSRAKSSRMSEMLPMRVTDSNRMSNRMSATPQSSFGRLNVPKPQSGTSERRTSFFGGSNRNTSGAGLHRNSIFGGFEMIKDTRPLHDKAFVQQCIGQLSEFLTEKGFPCSVSNKTLQSPSTKEFLKIFEFIYCQLDPTFRMPTSKVEEEVPRVLRDLGYPFALSKSSMYSVGAPHTWPQVLGSLIWLIDTVKTYYSMSEQKDVLLTDFSEDNMDIEEGAEYKKLFQDYSAETYATFMQGADTFEDEDEMYLAKLKKLYNVDEAMLASMEEKYRALRVEVEQLETESQTDRLMSKRKEKAKHQSGIQMIQTYRDELEAFKANLVSKDSALTEELEASGLQMESLKQEQSRLQHLHQNQKFTPADIERINREKIELQQTISRLTKNKEESEQYLWNEEIALAKVKEKMELKLGEYHKLARKLKLIPMSAENACGHDFEVKTSPGFELNPTVQYKTQIQIPLSKLISSVEEESTRLVNTKLTLEESIEQVNSNMSDKSNEVKQIREQIRRMDEMLEHDMQELEREEQKWAVEVESVENHLKLLEKNVTLGYEEAVEQLKTAKQQYHLVLQETNEKRRMVANNLTSVLQTAAEHLSIVEKYLEDLRDRLQRVYAKGIEESQAELQKLREMVDGYMIKAREVL